MVSQVIFIGVPVIIFIVMNNDNGLPAHMEFLGSVDGETKV